MTHGLRDERGPPPLYQHAAEKDSGNCRRAGKPELSVVFRHEKTPKVGFNFRGSSQMRRLACGANLSPYLRRFATAHCRQTSKTESEKGEDARLGNGARHIAEFGGELHVGNGERFPAVTQGQRIETV